VKPIRSVGLHDIRNIPFAVCIEATYQCALSLNCTLQLNSLNSDMGCCTKTNEKRVFGFLQLNNYFSMINFISFDIKISLIIGNKRKQDENLICKVIDKNRQAEAEVIFQSV
jgi:hypothetical protein